MTYVYIILYTTVVRETVFHNSVAAYPRQYTCGYNQCVQETGKRRLRTVLKVMGWVVLCDFGG